MSSSESVGDDPVSADDSGSESGGTWRFLREVDRSGLRTGAVGRGQTFFIQAFYVPSASMENTLLINDRILASKITTFEFRA